MTGKLFAYTFRRNRAGCFRADKPDLRRVRFR